MGTEESGGKAGEGMGVREEKGGEGTGRERRGEGEWFLPRLK